MAIKYVNLMKTWLSLWTFRLFGQMFGLSHGQKGHFNQMFQIKVIHAPKPLVKMTILLGQCEHFGKVGPSEKSSFLVVLLLKRY
jgi:hypothetical protein